MKIDKGSFLDVTENYDLKGAYIELTSECNLRCKHCYNQSGQATDLIKPTAFENIVNSLDSTTSSITLSGGEPLLSPYIWDYIELLKERKFEHPLIITNATLINSVIARRLAEANMIVQVSINGSSSDIHDALCGNGSFEKTMAGLKHLLNIGYNNIVVRATLSKINRNDMLKFIDLIKSLGLTKISIALLTRMGRATSNKGELSMSLHEKLETIAYLNHDKEFLEKISGLIVDVPEEDTTSGCPLIFSSKDIPLAPKIDYKGFVHICQIMYDKLYAIGNVNDMPLKQIITDSRFSNLIWFLRFGMQYINECQSCIWKSSCGKGCIAECINNGSVQCTDGKCPERKMMFKRDFCKSITTR